MGGHVWAFFRVRMHMILSADDKFLPEISMSTMGWRHRSRSIKQCDPHEFITRSEARAFEETGGGEGASRWCFVDGHTK